MFEFNTTLLSGFSLLPLLCGVIRKSNANVVIDTSDYRNSDITVHPLLPIQGQEAIIKSKIHNQSQQELSLLLSLQIYDSDNYCATKQISIAAKSVKEVEWKWVPKKNGWKKLVISATEDKTKKKISSSIQVPVIATPLYFSWFGEDKDLRYANLVMANDKETQNHWKSRGVLPWMVKSVKRAIPWLKREVKDKGPSELYKEYLHFELDKIGASAIHIDEIGGYSDREISERPHLEGIRLFKKKYPDIFVGLYVCGSLKPSVALLAVKSNPSVDLLLLESYLNYKVPIFNSYTRYTYFDQRILTARDYDALEHSLMVLGVMGKEDEYELSTFDLEEQVRYIRSEAPEMPGIGFYSAGTKNKELKLFADHLCLKYFIQPVIAFWDRDLFLSDSTPTKGSSVSIKAVIHNIGGMDAEKIKVSFYQGDPLAGGKKIGKSVVVQSLPADKGVPRGKYVVEQIWKPTKVGHHNLFVEVIPEKPGVTLLNGIAKRTVFVQKEK
ncbi:MAG: hypothetical protein WDA18_02630 [Candidatus Ratteibacteria bacterium]|jgi:hypothetical protein